MFVLGTSPDAAAIQPTTKTQAQELDVTERRESVLRQAKYPFEELVLRIDRSGIVLTEIDLVLLIRSQGCDSSLGPHDGCSRVQNTTGNAKSHERVLRI